MRRRCGPTFPGEREAADAALRPVLGRPVTATVHVLGAGLIGTSIGLALDGAGVLLSDVDGQRVDDAVGRGAGRAWSPGDRADLLVAAVPPSRIAAALQSAQRSHLASTFTHVSSVQSQVQVDMQTAGVAVEQVCGSHPMAGKEESGPRAAVPDLFAGRPWILCPGPATSTEALDAVRALAVACGGEPVVMAPGDHDASVALVSHLPQVAASAVAARLADAAAAHVALAGPGLQDTTRIAASDPALWLEVLRANAAQVAPLVHALAADLSRVAAALDDLTAAAATAGPRDGALGTVEDLLARGRSGRALVPVKRGARDADFVTVAVSVPDRPGQLAGLLLTAAQADVNVEDVHVEHLPGRPRGVIRLLVHRGAVTGAREALAKGGWQVLRTD